MQAPKCPICGEVGPCSFTRTKITHEPFTKDDWAALYQFMRTVYLPFIHRLVANARYREEQEEEET